MHAGIVVVLEPKELLVMEGGVAKFWCSPYIPIARPLLFRNGYILSQRNWDDRISYTDWSASAPGTGGNRTYSLTGATLQDHGSVFHCSVAGYISDAMVLSVFGKERALLLGHCAYWLEILLVIYSSNNNNDNNNNNNNIIIIEKCSSAKPSEQFN